MLVMCLQMSERDGVGGFRDCDGFWVRVMMVEVVVEVVVVLVVGGGGWVVLVLSECGLLLLQFLVNLVQSAGVQRSTRYKLLALWLIGICLKVALLEPILNVLYARRIDIAATP